MAWDSDTLSSDSDDLNSKPSDNLSPKPAKKGWGKGGAWVGKTKVKAAGKGFGKGIGTRKSTSAPRGEGRKGQTTKSNALKNA